MINDVLLTLLAGPVVPLPVPTAVVDALTKVQVTIGTREIFGRRQPSSHALSGFQLEFVLAKRSPLETVFMLTGGKTPPLIRIVLIATVNGTPNILVDGMVLQHNLRPGSGGGPSTLTLRGRDLTAAMDLFQFNGNPYPGMPAEARVLSILGRYASLGVIPNVRPAAIPDVPDPSEKIFAHQGTDYDYLCQLASDNGYVFYVEPGPAPRMNVAYWGPELKQGTPQPALNLDMDAAANVESLTFDFDNESSTEPEAYVRLDAVPIPIKVSLPDVGLVSPGLAKYPPQSFLKQLLPETAKMSLGQAGLYALSRAASAAECVTAEGRLDVVRYGRLLKPRQLVGVRGAGEAFNGLYYVRKVTHDISRGSYKQSFTLTRDGLVSKQSTVPA